jgi:hypothetical protein
VLLVFCTVAPVLAQGNGRGHGNGLTKKGNSQGTPSSGGAAQVQAASTVIRNFGAWLDDASLMTPGSGALSVSFGYFRSPLFREFDVPVADGGIGLTRRVQFGFSVPYYHVSEPGGPVFRGLGDLYLTTKVQLRDPSTADRGIGFAVTPVLEMLSSEPGPDGNRFNWALPVSAELQRQGWRVFGSTGYFSRGSVFVSAAVEVTLSERTSVTGTITQSHSLADDDPGSELILTRTRRDVSGGASYVVTPGVSVFGNAGRTISRQDANSATIVVSGGVSVNFEAWRRGTLRPR